MCPCSQASKDTAQALHGLGMTVNSMGGETELNLATYQFSGNAKRGLRYVQVQALGSNVLAMPHARCGESAVHSYVKLACMQQCTARVHCFMLHTPSRSKPSVVWGTASPLQAGIAPWVCWADASLCLIPQTACACLQSCADVACCSNSWHDIQARTKPQCCIADGVRQEHSPILALEGNSLPLP